MKFRTAYTKKCGKGLSFDLPSMTQQHFKDECDINSIISRYENTGSYYEPGVVPTRKAAFDDFSAVPDFMDAQNFIIEAGERFNELSSRIRRRFDNNPAKLLEFLSNPDNTDEAISLGIVSSPASLAADSAAIASSPGATQAE